MIWLLVFTFLLGVCVGFLLALWQIASALEHPHRYFKRFDDHD